MKKSKKVIIALFVLLLLISITCGVLYTSAKYTSSAKGNVSASVAKWHFDVSGEDSYNDTNTIQNLKIAQTCNASTLSDGKIAPGTSGSFDIIINSSKSEVGLDYTVSFSLADSTKALPTNLKFKLDGNDWSYASGISGKINADDETKIKTKTHTITWEWPYETTDGDEADTNDGSSAFNYSFNVQAVGTQVKPSNNN